MYLCPNCRFEYSVQSGLCHHCGWIPKEAEGIQVFLSNSDREDGFFKEYLDNYRELSIIDMEHGIVDRSYLLNQAAKMVSYYDGRGDESILEVGVGQGFLLRKLRDKFPLANIKAVDISIPFLQYIKSSIDVECVVANAENLPFKEEFDLVVASDILEHVINPIDFLLSVNYALKSAGKLMLRVPFEDNMLQYSRLLGCKHKFAHLRNFSRNNLIDILRQAGFEVEHVHYDGYYAYRRRPFFRSGRAQVLFERYISQRYSNENDVSQIPNWLGRILMKPLEIVVVTRKSRAVVDMNYLG